MRLVAFGDAIAVICAVLVLALALSSTPDLGRADTGELTATAPQLEAVAEHSEGGRKTERSCHPDLSCSPQAIVAAIPVLWEARIRAGDRGRRHALSLAGLIMSVDLPPPRSGTGLQAQIRRYIQA